MTEVSLGQGEERLLLRSNKARTRKYTAGNGREGHSHPRSDSAMVGRRRVSKVPKKVFESLWPQGSAVTPL